MIVVVVLGILTAIAFPSYQEYVMRARRTDGKGALLKTQQLLERAYTDKNNYTTAWNSFAGASGVTSENAYYNVTLASSTSATYQLNSAPQGTQVSDKCGTFILNQAYTKSLSGNTLSVADCWPR